MRIYDFPFAPNPTKLNVYLAEKGIEIPHQHIDIVKGEQSTPEFLAINPRGALPVLELDDGSHLCESLAIIEYLEELHPEPPMIGTTPLERARVREIERTIDMGVLLRAARIVHNRRSPLPGFAGIPAVAARELERWPGILRIVDERIGDQPFVAGDHPTIADCTLFAGLRFGSFGGLEVDPECRNLSRWHEAFKRRPSAQA
jgi:glutathione S-transferase